jgi:hypothetical protein
MADNSPMHPGETYVHHVNEILDFVEPDDRAALRVLLNEYHEACVTDTDWLALNTDYNANRWRQSMNQNTGAQASIMLIRAGRGHPQTGFLRLLEIRQVERSVEYSVLRPRWRPIFEWFPDVMDTARRILKQKGVMPPDEATNRHSSGAK